MSGAPVPGGMLGRERHSWICAISFSQTGVRKTVVATATSDELHGNLALE